MRPPAIERMGYYPTDEPVVEIIRTYLKPPCEIGSTMARHTTGMNPIISGSTASNLLPGLTVNETPERHQPISFKWGKAFACVAMPLSKSKMGKFTQSKVT